MTAIAGGPGKTAPKLVHDFLLFDPIKCDPNASYLTNFTPPFGEGRQLAPPVGSCQHEYATKHSQSVPPPLDLRPDCGTRYKLAVCCKKCRIHADLYITYEFAVDPCPNTQELSHHFLRREDVDTTGSERIQYGWQCSAESCRAQVRISYRTQRLLPEERVALTDTERLKRAYEAMMKDAPSREGLRQATPVEVLVRLRHYVKDSLNLERSKSSLSADNKRFGEAFGVRGRDFNTLLTRLGFSLVVGRIHRVSGFGSC
jgi:ubiquitin carboxyl-terminal hydrolase 25/28